MVEPPTTCWTVIEQAANGDHDGRALFALRYGPVVESYLRSRWVGGPLASEAPDAAQEVFLECLKEQGALERVAPGRPGGFRAYLYGVTRNVASRYEERRLRRREEPCPTSIDQRVPDLQERDLAEVFDKAWARSTVHQAAEIQRRRAQVLGAGALRRVELLELRFRDGIPIRDIARRWELEASAVHKDYARAREEFEDALREVIRYHDPAGAGIDDECRRIIALLE